MAGRIVLDTNVCLDLFVFDDPRCAHVREALAAGRVQAITDVACRDEWQRVLGYPQLALAPERQQSALAAFDAWMETLELEPVPEPGACTPGVPRCRDPHDQKFLELAWRGDARWLLSRDDHLLSLARRMDRVGRFRIQSPHDWTLPGA